ncbi:hypothetical protein FB451DRAFT_1172766 [Mycena latifolia]|nr:hypothetical protein FB451DRAFT_1172766 [Mycena latifolia]
MPLPSLAALGGSPEPGHLRPGGGKSIGHTEKNTTGESRSDDLANARLLLSQTYSPPARLYPVASVVVKAGSHTHSKNFWENQLQLKHYRISVAATWTRRVPSRLGEVDLSQVKSSHKSDSTRLRKRSSGHSPGMFGVRHACDDCSDMILIPLQSLSSKKLSRLGEGSQYGSPL